MIKGAAWKRRFSGLGFRLMAVMGLALLPLALLSYVQALQSARLSESRSTSAIMGETLVAAEPITALIVQTQGKAQALAAFAPDVIADLAACQALMDRMVAGSEGTLLFAGYVPRDGQMTCGAGGQQRDLSDSANLALMNQTLKPMMLVNTRGPVTNASVLIFTHPVRDQAGQVNGFVIMSMPHDELQNRSLKSDTRRQPLALVTFDATGKVLMASDGLEAADAMLPQALDLKSFVGKPGQSFLAPAVDGQRRAFAVVPLEPGALYLLGAWPANVLDDTFLEGTFPAFMFPALMWAASLLVAWIAAESQVLRHVRSLRDSITAFAGGERQLPELKMEDAAHELRAVGRAYERMTESVVRNEADLENTIHQKEVLLREVHHRVKNNLQLIASILNMQLRSARSAEAKEAMRTVQERVISLATVHRELYQTSGLADVRADELLPRVARDLLRIGSAPERQYELDADVQDIRLTPDQAVPLALFLTEGMANVVKHSWTGGPSRSRIGLQMKRRPGAAMAEFSLCNSLPPDGQGDAPAWTAAGDGFGSQLLLAFAQQLNGTITRGRQGDGYVLTLTFPLRPLTEAEERTSPPRPFDP